MAMDITCPFCGFSKETPEQVIPERAKWAICPRCQQKFEIHPPAGEGAIQETAREADKHDQVAGQGGVPNRVEAPWEEGSGKGFFRGTWQTFARVLFTPASFFKGLSVHSGKGEPFAFGLLAGALGNMLGLFWPVVLISVGILPVENSIFTELSAGLILLVLAVLIPIGVAIGMFLSSAVLHLLLLMVRAGGNGFEATFRVVAYSHATQAWELIPVIGSGIGGIWRLVVCIIGLREIHGTSYPRVIAALLLPVAFFVLLVIAMVVPLLIFLAG